MLASTTRAASIEKSRDTIRLPKVLIVEDDPQWQFILQNTVKVVTDTASIVSVSNIRDAQRMLRQHDNFDLILSDLVFHKSHSGLMLWRTLNQEQRQKFVLISGRPLDEFERDFAREKERPTFVSKLGSSEELRQKIVKTLKGQSRIRKLYLFLAVLSTSVVAGLVLNSGTLPVHDAPLSQNQLNAIDQAPAALEIEAIPESQPDFEIVQPGIPSEVRIQLDRILRRADNIISISKQEEVNGSRNSAQ